MSFKCGEEEPLENSSHTEGRLESVQGLFARPSLRSSKLELENEAEPNSKPKLIRDKDHLFEDQFIRLQVGERHFETTKDTLTEAAYFNALLSENWCHDARPDGSFFVDRDGDLFEHILRYLRTLILPIFYDNVKGHDELLYTALLHESTFYGIGRLRNWIREGTYLKAVHVTTALDVSEYECPHGVSGLLSSGLGEDFRVCGIGDIHQYLHWTNRQIYLCPRGILAHKGKSWACGRQCRNAKGPEDEFEEVPMVRVVQITKKTTIDRELCLGGWDN